MDSFGHTQMSVYYGLYAKRKSIVAITPISLASEECVS